MPSLTGKLLVLSLPVTACAAAGLLWLNRSFHADEARLAEVASSTHQRSMSTAEEQAAAMVAEARRSLGLVDGVRRLQMHVQRQVQAFKNVLLRGERPDQLERFTAEFETAQKAVAHELAALRGIIAADREGCARLDAFAVAHRQLTGSYRNAMAMIGLAETWGEGQHRADDYMVGRDAQPIALLDGLTTGLIDGAVAALAERQRQGSASLRTASAAGEQMMAETIVAADARNRQLGIVAIATLVAGVAAMLLVAWRRLLPIRAAAAAMDRLADGDLGARLVAGSSDEIGRLATSFNRSMASLRATLGAERVDWQRFAFSRREAVARLGADLGRTSAALVAAGQAGSATAQEIDAGSRRLSDRIAGMGGMLQRGAAGVEELNASLADVAAHARRADEAVVRTNGLAGTAAASLDEFASASARVAEAVELIGRIAKQVDLLALNATIESARAGEHGRGFTVVAGEVKALARRTGETTADIAKRIEAMRAASDRTAREVAAIRDLMREAATLVREVGLAVEAQVETTREMSSAIGAAAADGRGLAELAAHLTGIAAQGAAVAATTRGAAGDLERLSSDLGSALGGAA